MKCCSALALAWTSRSKVEGQKHDEEIARADSFNRRGEQRLRIRWRVAHDRRAVGADRETACDVRVCPAAAAREPGPGRDRPRLDTPGNADAGDAGRADAAASHARAG